MWLAGYVHNPEIAISTAVIVQQIDEIFYSIAYGFSQSTAYLVAEYIGTGNVECAKRAAKIGALLANCMIVVFIVMLMVTREYIAHIWTYDEEVIQEVASLIYVYIIAILVDTNKQLMMGIYRGLGFQRASAVVIFCSYMLICLPLLMILLFGFGYRESTTTGLYVIWSTLTFGNALSLCLITLWMLCGFADWNKFIIEANARLGEAHKHFS